MRYDTPIYFQRITPGILNPDTGNYSDPAIKEDAVYADVSDVSAEIIKLMYGNIRQGSLMIKLQNHYLKTFDRIRIADKVYRVDFIRTLRTKQTFVVSEVQ